MAAAAGTRVQLPEPKSLPLGPATNKLNQPKKVDTALLRPALTTTVTGMRQAIHALETGTLEVRSYLLNEVNLIYECKVCHNMFRSLVNLIAHKRSFCKQQYKQVTHFYDDQDNTKAAELETVVIEAEPIETVIQDDAWEIENYAPSLNLLKDADILQDIQSRPLINRLLPPKKQGLAGVVASLRAKVGNKDAGYYENQCRQIEARKSEAEAGTLYIEPISETSNGLFQTWKVTEGEAPTTGENYRVIQEKEKGISVTVSENGTAMPRGVPAELENWRERNGPVSPGSEGSKENHEDVAKQTKFQCPECKKLFTLVKTVVKHLVKFHNKTTDQAKLLRKKIKNNAITVKDTTPKKPRDEWYSHCTKCWTKFKTKAEEKTHHDSKTCKWRQSRPDDPYYAEFKGLPSHINRINAYVRVKNKKCSAFISGSRKGNGQASLDLSGLIRGKAMHGDSSVNDLEEPTDDFSDFGSRRISISDDDTDDTKSLDQMVVDRDMVEREELLPLKIESEMNRRNLMNKRKIKCNVCYDMKFKSTYLLKRHVATEHMLLERWRCTICDFRIWSRDECLRHATDNHRLRGSDKGIAERSLDEYFKEYLDRREAEERLETETVEQESLKDFMMMEDGSMVVGETSARNSFENCNGDDGDDGEVSFTVKDISPGGEPRKRKRSSGEESLTASEESSAKQYRSSTSSPVLEEVPTTPSKSSTSSPILEEVPTTPSKSSTSSPVLEEVPTTLSKSLPGKVISSFMDDISSQSNVPNLDESQKEESMSPATIAESRSSDLNGSPQKSNGL